MKHVVSLLAGVFVGALLFLALLYQNPFAVKPVLSPLSVADGQLIDFAYSPVPGEAIALTNDGSAAAAPSPDKIAELWEPAVNKTRVLVTALHGSGGEVAGIGIKFSSDSESTRLLRSEAIVDSVWHIWLPDSGSLFIDQRENFWSYLRGVVIPARLSSSSSWRGSWYGTTTVGPGALGTAHVTGGSGRFDGISSEASESLRAGAWSATQGPVAMSGNILISLTDYVAD